MFFQLRMPELHLVCNYVFHLLPVHLGLLGYDDDDMYINTTVYTCTDIYIYMYIVVVVVT